MLQTVDAAPIGTDVQLLNRRRTVLLLGMASSAARRGSFKVRRSPQKVISKGPSFDVKLFLDSAGVGRKVVRFRRNDIVFAQGDPSKHVTYIQEGSVKLSVVNETGKEAVVAILGPGDFLGEGCIAGQSTCMATATAVASTSVLIINKNEIFARYTGNMSFPIVSSRSC